MKKTIEIQEGNETHFLAASEIRAMQLTEGIDSLSLRIFFKGTERILSLEGMPNTSVSVGYVRKVYDDLKVILENQ
jgi:hypothetical protein